jgi:hypothetical protein
MRVLWVGLVVVVGCGSGAPVEGHGSGGTVVEQDASVTNDDAGSGVDGMEEVTDAEGPAAADAAPDACGAADAAVDTSPCVPACTLGAKKCGLRGGLMRCVLDASSNCPAWGSEISCSGSQRCKRKEPRSAHALPDAVCACPADAGCVAVDEPLLLPLDHTFCDEPCLALPPVVITVCPQTEPSCTPTRSTTVTWRLEGRPFRGLLLAILGVNAISRVESGSAQALGSYLIFVHGGRAIVRSDVDVTLTYNKAPPVWGGETMLEFNVASFSGQRTTTHYYSFAGAGVGELGAQLHELSKTVIADEEAAVELTPSTMNRAFFFPTELVSQGEGDFAFPDGTVTINYGNPDFWAASSGIVAYGANRFAHEYAHQLVAVMSPPYLGNPGCLVEGLANATGVLVGRTPAWVLGPMGGHVFSFEGDCKLATAGIDAGNCYFYHANKAGLLDASFLRGLFHPQHMYAFDSCSPSEIHTGDSLVVLFSEASGQDQTLVVSQMGIPNSGSYAAAKAALGF